MAAGPDGFHQLIPIPQIEQQAFRTKHGEFWFYAIVQADIKDSIAFQKYIELAGIAAEKYDAEFLIRGGKTKTKDGISRSRTTLVRFDNMEIAEAFYDSNEYQQALKLIRQAADRDYKLVEGI